MMVIFMSRADLFPIALLVVILLTQVVLIKS